MNGIVKKLAGVVTATGMMVSTVYAEIIRIALAAPNSWLNLERKVSYSAASR